MSGSDSTDETLNGRIAFAKHCKVLVIDDEEEIRRSSESSFFALVIVLSKRLVMVVRLLRKPLRLSKTVIASILLFQIGVCRSSTVWPF